MNDERTLRDKASDAIHRLRLGEVPSLGDTLDVLQAYLDEHPADDDEPVTREWLLAAGGTLGRAGRLGAFDWAAFRSPRNDQFWFEAIAESRSVYQCHESRGSKVSVPLIATVTTRREFRALCRALGVVLKDNAE